VGERLYWGVVDDTPPERDADGAYRAIRDGWRCTDLHGEQLTKDRLSGALTKLAAYQGTSCDVKDAAEYVVRRINGRKVPQVERAIVASAAMKSSALDLMRLLTPRDFETLVDLVFSTSGWRRIGIVNTRIPAEIHQSIPNRPGSNDSALRRSPGLDGLGRR
jgi:hypothetical protein